MRANLFPAPTLDFLDGYLFHILQQIATDSGLEKSGLTSYYGSRLEMRVGGLLDYEVDLAKLLTERCAGKRLVHAGMGIGTLTSVLACRGFEIAGVEVYEPRVATAKRIREIFAKIWPDVDKRYTIFQGYYPQSVDSSWFGSDVTVIFTNVGAGWDDVTTSSIISSLSRFGEAYLDLRLFGSVRANQEDREALFERIAMQAKKVERILGVTPIFDLARFEFDYKPSRIQGAVMTKTSSKTGVRRDEETRSFRNPSRDGNTIDPGQLIDDVDTALTALHSRRLVELGDVDSGLYNHYALLLRLGSVVQSASRQAFKLITEVLPPYAEYAVLRAGLGELAFLLNAVGLKVVACQSDQLRLKALEAGCEQLVPHGSKARQSFRVCQDILPESCPYRPVLGVATDFIFDRKFEDDEAFRRGLQGFDGLLIHPRLFLAVRESLQDQRAALEFLASLEFTEVDTFPESQMVYLTRSGGAGLVKAGSAIREGEAARRLPGFARK